MFLLIQGGGDTDQDGREKNDGPEKVSPFEEDKSPEMKVGDDGDPAKANGRSLLNGMDRDCKDFKYVCGFFFLGGSLSNLAKGL